MSRYYTFTVPLTFALFASLSLFIGRKMSAFAEAVLLLFLSHLLYVFFVEGTILTDQLMLNGIEPESAGWLSFYAILMEGNGIHGYEFRPFFDSRLCICQIQKIKRLADRDIPGFVYYALNICALSLQG